MYSENGTTFKKSNNNFQDVLLSENPKFIGMTKQFSKIPANVYKPHYISEGIGGSVSIHVHFGVLMFQIFEPTNSPDKL